MTHPELIQDIANWQQLLHQDLVDHLAEVRLDGTVRGFALELPTDFSNDLLISLIAKQDGSEPAQKSTSDLARWERTLDEWQYVPNGNTFDNANTELEHLYEKYATELEDEDFYTQFGDQLYSASLAAMKQYAATTGFGEISVRLLTFSDDEHPILEEAIVALNDEREQHIARRLLGI